MTKRISCSNELVEWLEQLTKELNESLPKDRQLSQKDVSRMVPRLFTHRTVRLNIVLGKRGPGRPSHNGKLKEYEEFLL